MSEIRVNAIKNTSGVEVYTAKAWVNFNGTGTVAIRASGNVTSITDNGVGDYSVNFTSAAADANYAVVVQTDNFGSSLVVAQSSIARGNTASAARMAIATLAGSAADVAQVSVAIFR